MGFKNIPSRAKTNHQKNVLKRRDYIQASVAADIRRKEKLSTYQPNDVNKFHLGEDWFNAGMLLEDAEESLRNNVNFVNGFNRAKRIRDVEEYQYSLGIEFYKNGVSVEQILEEYKEKPFVLKGFKDAKESAKKKQLGLEG